MVKLSSNPSSSSGGNDSAESSAICFLWSWSNRFDVVYWMVPVIFFNRVCPMVAAKIDLLFSDDRFASQFV